MLDPNVEGDGLVARVRAMATWPTDRLWSGGRNPAGRRPGAGADFVIEAVGLDHVKPKLESGPDPTGILPMQQGYQMCALGGHYITTGLPRGNITLPGSLFAIGGVSHHGGQAGGASPMRDIPRFVETDGEGSVLTAAAGHHRRPARSGCSTPTSRSPIARRSRG